MKKHKVNKSIQEINQKIKSGDVVVVIGAVIEAEVPVEEDTKEK